MEEKTKEKDITELVFEARIRTNNVSLISQLLEMGIINAIGVNKEPEDFTTNDNNKLTQVLKQSSVDVYTYYDDFDYNFYDKGDAE